MSRVKNEDGTVFRGVALFVNPLTGEEKYFYTGAYAGKGAASAALTKRLDPRWAPGPYFYPDRTYDHNVRKYTHLSDAERFPFVEKWVERADQWVRV